MQVCSSANATAPRKSQIDVLEKKKKLIHLHEGVQSQANRPKPDSVHMGFTTRQCKLFLVPRAGDMIRIRNIRMKTASTVLLILAALAAAAVAAFLLAGPARVWRVFGDPDLGPVVFETLQRRTTPNDALACRPQLCAAAADIEAPVIPLTPAELFPIVSDAVSAESRLEQVAADPDQGTLRFVQRSPLMRFPDTIDVKLVPLAEGGTVVLLYSRSQLGREDMGVNRERIERWVGLIVEGAGK